MKYCVLLIAFLCVACSSKPKSVPYYNTADCTPVWVADPAEVSTRITHTLMNFTLRDQTGATITRASVIGKIHVANFIFTTCKSLCPKMAVQFKVLQDSFARDNNVLLLSYSVAPRSDSVARLREYAEEVGAKSEKWHLLTGDKAEIYELARSGYFAEQSTGVAKDSSEFLHTEHFVLVDGTGRIRGIYNGTLRLETQRLMEDIRSLESEKNL